MEKRERKRVAVCMIDWQGDWSVKIAGVVLLDGMICDFQIWKRSGRSGGSHRSISRSPGRHLLIYIIGEPMTTGRSTINTAM